MRDDAPIQTDSGVRGVGERGGPADPDPGPPLNFRILALLWLFVSAGAAYLLVRDPGWRTASGILQALGAVRMEQWLAILLLGVQVWLVFRGWWRGRS